MTEETRIAYLSVEKTASGNGYIGGLLVIDANGIPLEFLCTYSVRPSDTQRHLYGDTLEPHISVDLCGKNLLAKMKGHVSVVLVNNTIMLSAREICDHPMISLRRPDSPDQIYVDVDRYKMEVGKGNFGILETSCNKKHAEDWQLAMPILQEVSQKLDLLEPFQRITVALQALGKRDEKFA